MPVPKRKRSRSRRDKRFANKGFVIKAFTECRNCQEPLMTHQACAKCGFYKGNKVMDTKIDRALKRAEVRKAKGAQKQISQQAAGQSGPEST